MDLKFRGLYPDEIDIRVGNVSQRGATLLLYKNARVDMALLDQVVGPMNWQRDHKEVKGNMYCGIGITDGHDWVWKWDCGTESNTEAEKGESSDSFKRAGFNWGLGRELYTAPLIFINCETEADGYKYKLKNKSEFYDTKVSKIEYERLGYKVVGYDVTFTCDGGRAYSEEQTTYLNVTADTPFYVFRARRCMRHPPRRKA